MSFLADPIGNISGGIHDLGKSPLGRMAEAAALMYFTGDPEGFLASGGESFAANMGLSAAQTAGIAMGAVTTLGTGSLEQGLKAGLMSGGLYGLTGPSSIDGLQFAGSTGTGNVIPEAVINPVAEAAKAGADVVPTNVVQNAVQNAGPSFTNMGVNPMYNGTNMLDASLSETATPLQNAVNPTNALQAPTQAPVVNAAPSINGATPNPMYSVVPQAPATSSGLGLNPGLGASPSAGLNPTPSAYFGSTPPPSASPGFFQTVKNWAIAHPYYAGAAGVAGLAALKAAAKPNTVGKLPDNRKIKYYGGNPYSGASFLRETPAVAATGGLVALAKGGIAHFADGGDAALAAYQAGDYGQAAQLLGASGMSAQDVVTQYHLDPAQAAQVASNLGYTGDLSGLNYGTPAGLASLDKSMGAATPVQAGQMAIDNSAASAPVPAGLASLDRSMGASTPAQAGQIAINNAAATAAPATPAYTSYTPENMANFVQQSGINLNDPAALAAAIKKQNADPTAVNAFLASEANPFSYKSLSNPTAASVNAFDATLGTAPANMGINNAIATAYKNTGATENLAGNIQGNTQLAKEMDAWNVPPAQMAKVTGLTEAKIQALYDAVNPNGKYASKTATTTKSTTTGTTASTGTLGTTTTQNGTVLNTYTPPGSTTPIVLNPTQRTTTNVTTPTDIATAPASALAVGVGGNNALINPNGTVSQPAVSASAPGMQAIRDAYTRKGGSLGYVNPAAKPVTTDAATQHYLDMLSGKAPMSKVPYTPTGEIAKPYYTSVMGMKENPRYTVSQPYIFNPATRKYVDNPNYDQNFSATADYVGDAQKGLKQSTLDFFKAAGVNDPTVDTKTLDKAVATSDAAASSDGAPADFDSAAYLSAHPDVAAEVASGKLSSAYQHYMLYGANGSKIKDPTYAYTKKAAGGGLMGLAAGGLGTLGGYSDGGRLLRGPGDGISDSIPATIGSGNPQPARLADGEFVVPARIVSELGNGSTEAGARKLYQMMDRVQKARKKTTGKQQVATNPRAEQYLPA